jgi:hypothetical protein
VLHDLALEPGHLIGNSLDIGFELADIPQSLDNKVKHAAGSCIQKVLDLQLRAAEVAGQLSQACEGLRREFGGGVRV